MKDLIHNHILVHVARTWERIRIGQPHQEMGQDNIESVDSIVCIAEDLYADDVIQGFVTASEQVRGDDYWIKNTEEGMSDLYIEGLAYEIITKEFC